MWYCISKHLLLSGNLESASVQCQRGACNRHYEILESGRNNIAVRRSDRHAQGREIWRLVTSSSAIYFDLVNWALGQWGLRNSPLCWVESSAEFPETYIERLRWKWLLIREDKNTGRFLEMKFDIGEFEKFFANCYWIFMHFISAW